MKDVLGDRKAIAILLGPALLIFTLVKLVPVMWSFGLTFFQGDLRGFEFVGLDNFAQLFADPTAPEAIFFSIKYSLIATVAQIALGYALSLFYVFVLKKASTLVRTLVFFPVVLPTVAVGLLFKRLFEVAPQTGPVNAILNGFGIDSVDWFSSPDSAFFVIIIMDLWRSMGFYAVLLYAGLLDIPEEVIESARIDGARGLKLVRYIIVPLSLPVLLSAVIFSFNATLKVFDSVLALTGGGPGTATTPLTLYMYNTTFTYQNYGYGSTLAFVLTIMCFLVTLLIFKTSRKDLTKD
ncbi:carbohydrate ABC transporter permease [Plantibacter sp. CFBP 8775]|uniref:carbohydrate ABC transporter permease n=1 Tax=Plantibacter sp. CFBP 8775 TaxID=2774038 RepID=UPI0017811193|nr:sugar ABC transporter permease [Plantibacter sp. CFBP 8775]MBD8104556.1 sugar ABC transporter permease [Plantibacter sp. CFBP 8775]